MRTVKKQEYYLGLDIGTESIGYAVTDENYQILRFNGKDMWGSRLFDPAKTAEERRVVRTTRRRLGRRHWRLQILQELFAEEISKVDMGFYQKLKESFLLEDDKTTVEIANFFDSHFYNEYPTIYHLRKSLIEQSKIHDIRELYMGIHHIFKHRGHFLFAGDMEQVTSFEMTYDNFITCLNDELEKEVVCQSVESFAGYLKDTKLTKKDKNNKVIECLQCDKSDKQLKAIIGLLCGSKVKLSDVFQDPGLIEYEKNSFSFEQGSYDEERIKLEDVLQERIDIIDIIKTVYDWAILADILQGGEHNGKSFLSFAKVNQYEKHANDLKLLKEVLNEDEEVYRQFFKKQNSANYCAYIGSYKKAGKKVSVKRCTQEEFYKAVKKEMSKIKSDNANCEKRKMIEGEMVQGTFMPLQVSKDNGVIPYQVHKMELIAILEGAKETHTFLTRDIIDKIIGAFEFRIPYYVGPINTVQGKNSWMIRKEEGRILPWNFQEKVDLDQSAEKFIRRMTNKCTYLVGEDVLPKHSLLYSEFTVWNELNNVKFKDDKLSVEMKQSFFEKCFMKKKRVTGKLLVDFLKSEGIDATKEDLSGFDQNFASSLTSYLDFKKIFEDRIELYSMKEVIEQLILWITLYGDDKNMLKRVIRTSYSNDIISDKELKKVLQLKYQGWGRFSQAFLSQIEGTAKETGEIFTIIQGLKSSNQNLMQLLSQEYTFTEYIEEVNRKIRGEITSITYENVIQDLMISPPVKKAAWQVVQIAEEIRKIMGRQPKKIFVEMARGKEANPQRTESRRSQLMYLYKDIKTEERNWKEELEKSRDSDFRSIKLYLYYTQMGCCMYSGKPIPLSRLADTTIYDRDHIYPQSKTKDDSLDNLVLVEKNINAKKSDDVLSSDIQNARCSWWKMLLDKKLISKEKYNRLMRKSPLSQEELAGFINRQLVETRQSSKIVADLFKQLYQETRVVYVKSGRVSDFRKTTIKQLKVRSMNDHHHAKDAYLNIVVGNVYDEKFTNNSLQWLKNNPNASYSLNHMYDFDLIKNDKVIWKRGKEGTIAIVSKMMSKNSVLYTRHATCNKGELFNQQLVGKEDNPGIQIKKGMDITKYGGYKSVNPAYFVLVESKDKKGNIKRGIEAMPLYLSKQFEEHPEDYLKYCEDKYGLIEPRVVISKIKKNAYMIVNGFPMHIRGTNGKDISFQGAVQLCLNEKSTIYLKKIEKYIARNLERRDKKEFLMITEMEGITLEDNLRFYDILLEKHKNTIYKYRPANQAKAIELGRSIFKELTLEEQCVVINEILKLMQCKPITANLKLIGGSSNAGLTTVNKNTMMNSAYLVNQSITGLFEQKIDLRTV